MRNLTWLLLISAIAGFVSGCSSPAATISQEEAAAQQQRANKAQHELDSAAGK